MTERRKKRPRDPLQLAKLIGDIATGQTEDRADAGEEKAASARARLGGLEGGKARAEAHAGREVGDSASGCCRALEEELGRFLI